jgi:hypothetical protein
MLLSSVPGSPEYGKQLIAKLACSRSSLKSSNVLAAEGKVSDKCNLVLPLYQQETLFSVYIVNSFNKKTEKNKLKHCVSEKMDVMR